MEEVRQVVGKKIKVILVLLVGFVFFGTKSVFAESVPEKFPLNGIYDPHNYLSSETISNISVFNWEHSKNTNEKENPRIAVVIIDELDNDIEEVVERTAKEWNFAYSEVLDYDEEGDSYELDNGILLFISVKDGEVYVRKAKNNSLNLNDEAVKNLKTIVKSNFEKGMYSQGVYSYVESLKQQIKAADTESPGKVEFGSKNKNMSQKEKEKQKISRDVKEGYDLGVVLGFSFLIGIPILGTLIFGAISGLTMLFKKGKSKKKRKQH